MPSGSLLVATICRRGLLASSASARWAHASMRCSQLSRTSRACASARPSSSRVRASRLVIRCEPSGSRRDSRSPIEPRTAFGTSAASVTEASSTIQIPSGRLPSGGPPAASSRSPLATSAASRVLPAPPGPTRVTRRPASIVLRTRATSSSRPTKLVSGARRFVRVRSAGAVGAVISPRSTSRWTARTCGPGSMPSSSDSRVRSVSYTASASACRPVAARVRISSPASFSCSGCSATSASIWPAHAVARPPSSSRVRKATCASSRSSSRRRANGAAKSPASASAGPRHSASASATAPSAMSRSKRSASTSSGASASRYPAADCSTAAVAPSARRARETSACSAFPTSAGGA